MIVIDLKCRTIVFPKSELAGYGVEAKADFSDEIEWILVGCGLNHPSDTQADRLLACRRLLQSMDYTWRRVGVHRRVR